MEMNPSLEKIRKELFYGSSSYTKNQPDLFVPHRFQMLPPSKVGGFMEMLGEAIRGDDEILLYFHLPFCFSECLFCNSFPLKVDRAVQQDYLNHLLGELELFSNLGIFDGKRARAIYFGGGTPTSFSNSDLRRIVEKIRSSIRLSDNCSINTEAHPATIENEARIRELAEIGFNRISTGCQTFDPEILARCNRSNTVEQLYRIVRTAQAAGISVNIDMMTGLPGQTVESVRRDLEMLEKIRPDAVEYIRHEIVNPLIMDRYKSEPDLVVDDDALFEMVYITQEWMENHGYEQNGRFTDDRQWGYRYYWLKEMPIIAFGSRTRSYTPTICYDKHEDLQTYSRMVDKGVPPVGRYILLTERERMYRSLILGLQLKNGLGLDQFRKLYGLEASDVFGGLMEKLGGLGCIQVDADAVRLTRYGAVFVEDVCDFIIDFALKDESSELVRASHSGGNRFTEVLLEQT